MPEMPPLSPTRSVFQNLAPNLCRLESSGTCYALFNGRASKSDGRQGRKAKSFPCLRAANGQRGWPELDVRKNIGLPLEGLAKFRMEPNASLISEGGDGDTVGRTAIRHEEIAHGIHQGHIFRARLVSKGWKPEWFMPHLSSPVGRHRFESASKQTTKLASINDAERTRQFLFLQKRAEQIYRQREERRRVVFAGHFAHGLEIA